jgi:3-oxo-5-alpha-steroid 4-dehydrogenase 3
MNFLESTLALFYVSATISVLIISVIPSLKSEFFPYGKTLVRLNKWLVPKYWFMHFYIVGILSSIAALFFKRSDRPVVTLLFFFHCIRRLLECWLSRRSESKMHITHYIIGILYYLLTAWAWDLVPLKKLVIGGAIWLFGSLEQKKSHAYLRKLVKRKQEYPLPNQGYFIATACPHYFFEVCIYAGMALMSQFHYISVLILIWVIVDLHFSATEQWKWYRSHYHTPNNYKKWIPMLI